MQSFAGRRKGRGNRAVSPAIAHVLMAAAVVSIGIAVLFWSTGTFGTHKSEASTFFSTSSEAMKESLVIEDVWFFEDSEKHVNVTVRNVGTVDLAIVSICIDDEEVWNGTQLIKQRKAATIEVDFAWQAGEHSIVATTARGNEVKEWYGV